MNDKFVSATYFREVLLTHHQFTILNYFYNLLGYFLLNKLSHTLGISSVIKNDKSVYAAIVKHISNIPYEFRKLYLIDSR